VIFCTSSKDSYITLRRFPVIMLLVCLVSACQNIPATQAPLPTLIRIPTLTATLHPSESPTATFTPSVTATATATYTETPSATSRLQSMATDTITPTILPSPTMTATALPERFVFGQSAGGRDLESYRYGTGRYVIMIVGGIHAGFESNTIDLVSELRVHFQSNRDAIDPEITFIFVPVLNPDGQSRGRILEGRFNGNNVDLNRNWACGWSPDAQFGQGIVDPGTEAFSEPESTALGSLIQRVNPSAVMFYHSAANGVFAGNCGENSADSDGLAAIYGEASGYPYGSEFDEYPVTGTAPGWVDSIGIPALDIELATAQSTEFERNLRAIMIVQQWVQGR